MDSIMLDDIVKNLEGKLTLPPSKIEGLDDFNVDVADFGNLKNQLGEFGKVEGNVLLNKGPILVIFRERHSNNNSKKENFLAFQMSIDYYNFLGTEGQNGEIIGTGLEEVGIRTEQMVDFILGGNISFSSEAIEGYYGNKISTFGVDLPGFLVKALREKAIKLAYNISLAGLGENNPHLKIESEKKAEAIFNSYLETIIKGRNSIWLENIIRILKNNNHKTGKNFIAVVGGAEHAENLGVQAMNMGFKGYLIFTPNSLQNK